MRRLVSLFCLLIVVFANKAAAQIISIGNTSYLNTNQPEQDACHAIEICGNHDFNYAYRGFGSINDISNLPFNYIEEENSVWIKFKCVSSGTLLFTIIPVNTNNDYDFAVYKNVACGSINFPTVPLRVNHAGCSGATGLALNPMTITAPMTGYPGILEYPFSDSIHANSGDEFLVLVSWSGAQMVNNVTHGFAFDFTGSTVTLTSDSLPKFDQVIGPCNKSQEVMVRMTEPVSCASIAADGSDFYITPQIAAVSGAYSDGCFSNNTANASPWNITIQFSSPLPAGQYWLHAAQGNDGNSLANFCGVEQPISDSILFTVDPYTPITFTGVDSPACQYLVVALSGKVYNDSIAPNGSDFAVTGASLVSVAGAMGVNPDAYNLVDSVLVVLSDAIKTAGIYSLIIQKGNDHNTLVDTCKAQMIVGTKIDFSVNPYNGILLAAPDTLLCKADTIHLRSANIITPDKDCGVDTSTGGKWQGIQMTRTTPGVPPVIDDFLGNSIDLIAATPFRDRWHSTRMQILIRASELQEMGLKAGVITKLGWVENASLQAFYPRYLGPPLFPGWTPPNVTYNEFTIRLGCTNASSVQTGLVPFIQTNQVTVYSGSNYTPHHGVNEFALSQPYVWDGFSNLLIDICTYADSLKFATPYFPVAGYWKYPLFVNLSKTNFNSSRVIVSNHFVSCDSGSIIDQSDASTIAFYGNYRPDTRITMTSLPGPGGPYQWLPAAHIIEGDSNPNAIAYVPATTDFAVSTVDRFGCYLRDMVSVVVSSLSALVSPTDTSICVGDSLTLHATSNMPTATYSWDSNHPEWLSCLHCDSPWLHPIDSTIANVIVTDQLGCADTLPAIVNVIPLPEVIGFPQDTIVKYGTSIQLRAEGADYYSWAPGRDLDYATAANPIATPQEPTDFVVVGLAMAGCRNSDTIHIDIDYDNPLFVPSVFSPNGDGKNDLFRVVNLNFQRVQEFRIFNRWGNEIFSAQDNRGWDGKYKGELQDVGTYQYLIRVGIANGESQLFKGDVTLIR